MGYHLAEHLKVWSSSSVSVTRHITSNAVFLGFGPDLGFSETLGGDGRGCGELSTIIPPVSC